MSIKREHIWKKEQELKWCPRCKQFLPLENFHTTGNQTWDNLYYLCIRCINNERVNNPRRNALSAWNNIRRRIAKDPRYKCKKIQVKMLKTEFIVWYVKNWFLRCRVDRVDNDGHYELSNIQLLTQQEHNAKARQDRLSLLGVVEPKGMRYCYSCEFFKPYKEFYIKKRKISFGNPLGLEEECKQCSRTKRIKYYKKRKESPNGKNI